MEFIASGVRAIGKKTARFLAKTQRSIGSRRARRDVPDDVRTRLLAPLAPLVADLTTLRGG